MCRVHSSKRLKCQRACNLISTPRSSSKYLWKHAKKFLSYTFQSLIFYFQQRLNVYNYSPVTESLIVTALFLFLTKLKYSVSRWPKFRVSECVCLQVDEQQLKRQLEEITVIIQVREKLNTKFPVSVFLFYFYFFLVLVYKNLQEFTTKMLVCVT